MLRVRQLLLLSCLGIAVGGTPLAGADGDVFRVFHVETAGVSDGLGQSGHRPAPDYYIDGGLESGLARGQRLDVFRRVTVEHPSGDRPRTIEIRFAQAEVVEAYARTAIVRTRFVDPVESEPIVGLRAIMIGDLMVVAREPEPDPEREEASLRGKPAPAAADVSLHARVLFDFDSAILRPEGLAAITAVRDRLRPESEEWLLVEGHTCDLGPDGYNRELSLRRAESIAGFLVAGLGLDAERIVVRGRGESSPVAPNDGDHNRYLNRRVDFRVLDATETSELR